MSVRVAASTQFFLSLTTQDYFRRLIREVLKRNERTRLRSLNRGVPQELNLRNYRGKRLEIIPRTTDPDAPEQIPHPMLHALAIPLGHLHVGR